MLLWSSRLPPFPVCATFAFPFFLLELVPTLFGGLVGHPPVLSGLQLSRLRCCQDGTAPVGCAVTGQGRQEHADYLAVAKYLVMWLICSLVSVLPCNPTLPPPYPIY